MRRTGLMRSRQQAALSVSLFPFLAVLICTMGALILLLVVIARQSRLQAAQAVDENEKQQDEKLQIAREDVQWRIEQLETSRQRTTTQLDEARLALGHLEDHSRRLRNQIARLRAAYNDLNRLDGEDNRQREELEAQRTRMKTEIADAQHRLDQVRRVAAEKSRSYAVVPYQGPHETYRRPIYIECREDAIVLQPEGIVFTDEDFEGPMGPGNPLAAALRAAREYMLDQGDFDPEKSGEPYPLMLVRPDGIVAFYAARAAMKSWGSEFGYELVGKDWKLDFEPPDALKARVVNRAVDLARVRQKRLARAAPRHYRGSGPQRTEYRASPTRGGVVVDGGLFGGDGAGSESQQSSGTFGSRREATGDRWSDAAASSEAAAGDRTDHQAATTTGSGRESPRAFGANGRVLKQPGEWQSGGAAASQNPSAGKPAQHAESLAKSRGRDWGLPDAAGSSVPVSRPIQIECHRDRLVVLPERGLEGGKTVRLGSRTEDSIDEFISGVWEYMDRWGIAGKGMYWRPILNVHIEPGAEQRYAELKTLLDGSGLTVEMK